MSVRSFDLGSCPKVRRDEARDSRRLLRSLAAVPARLDLDLPPLGPARLTFHGLAVEPTDPAAVEIALRSAGTSGVMTIAGPLAGSLADSAIAGRPFQGGVRRLGPAERGLVAGLLATLVGRLGWTVRLDGLPRGAGQGPVLVFWLETKVGAGELRIGLPAGDPGPVLATARWDRIARARAEKLPITLAVEIALTDLGAGEVMTAGPGDVVVFEGTAVSALASEAQWPARLSFRSAGARYQIPVEIDARGEMTVGGVISQVHEEGRMDASDSNSGFDAVTVLAGAPIEVVAELGRITLRGDELLGLAPGAVLRLAAGRKTVALRASNELWAEGEIVDVEGELGVRVTRVFSR